MGAGVLGFDPALLDAIATRVGTPAYVYGANLIRAQFHALDDALQGIPHRICYSVKANGNLAVLRVLQQVGAGADIVSVGELRRVHAAGFASDLIVFSGVGKTAAELEEAIARAHRVSQHRVDERARRGHRGCAAHRTAMSRRDPGQS